MTELREYQEELLHQVQESLRPVDTQIMMQLPTGGGKTVIAAHLLSDHLTEKRKAVWLTHRKELADQTKNMLDEVGVPAMSNIQWTPRTKAPRIVNGVVILMAQTVTRRTVTDGVWDDYDDRDLMIIDEAHHAAAEGWERAICQWPGRVLGMTATPWRLSKNEGFGHLFSELICGPQVADLQSQEFLCGAQVLLPTDDDKILGGKIGPIGDYTEKGIERANNKDVMTIRALKFWQEHAIDRQTIIYAVSRGHAHNLAAVFKDAGITAEVILGETQPEDRANAIENFAKGKLKALVNVAVATEGFDLPDASCVVIARPTKSLSLYLQMVGRGLRPKSYGGDCLILDLADNALEHGLPEENRRWSLAARGESTDGEAPVARCEQCPAVSPAASHSCKSCGEPFGKDCQRCGKWRSSKNWTLEDWCKYTHDEVCDLCHQDVHVQAQLPKLRVIYPFERESLSSNSNVLSVEKNAKLVTAALLTVLQEMGGEGATKDVTKGVGGMLYGISSRQYQKMLKREHLMRHSSPINYENLQKTFSIIDPILISRYVAPSSSSDVSAKIQQAHKRLQNAGYCDPTSPRGIWRLTPEGRELAKKFEQEQQEVD